MYDYMCIKGNHRFIVKALSYVCHPPPCLHLAADKDGKSVQVVESEEGADGNFATVDFTMVSMWE